MELKLSLSLGALKPGARFAECKLTGNSIAEIMGQMPETLNALLRFLAVDSQTDEDRKLLRSVGVVSEQ